MNVKKIVNICSYMVGFAVLSYIAIDVYLDHSRGKPSLIDDFNTKIISPEIKPSLETSQNQEVEINNTKEGQESSTKDADLYADHIQTKAWLEDRGYFSHENTEAYETYNENTLADLAKTGDKLALDVLASRYIQKGERDKAIPLIKESIARGASAALADLAIFTLPNYTNEDNLDSRKKAIIETFAVYRVAEIMGDLQVSEMGLKNDKAMLEKRYGALNFTQEDFQLVEKRAQELFSEFREERMKLGLGEFDTSTPKVFKEKYSSAN